jgi:hypothetical protein
MIERDALSNLLVATTDEMRHWHIQEIKVVRELRGRIMGVRDTFAEDQRKPTVV